MCAKLILFALRAIKSRIDLEKRRIMIYFAKTLGYNPFQTNQIEESR
jgi:hypothetical protein